MKHLISWDDDDDAVEIRGTAGWREPWPGELSRLATVLHQKPAPWWLDAAVVVAVVATIALLAAGGWR